MLLSTATTAMEGKEEMVKVSDSNAQNSTEANVNSTAEIEDLQNQLKELKDELVRLSDDYSALASSKSMVESQLNEQSEN